ncbi:hypothetical protein J6590_012111 [Homalodisca vitripennis]|nr:hypothetical protein J6590_012111 [Homalodisca vitripennis]
MPCGLISSPRPVQGQYIENCQCCSTFHENVNPISHQVRNMQHHPLSCLERKTLIERSERPSIVINEKLNMQFWRELTRYGPACDLTANASQGGRSARGQVVGDQADNHFHPSKVLPPLYSSSSSSKRRPIAMHLSFKGLLGTREVYHEDLNAVSTFSHVHCELNSREPQMIHIYKYQRLVETPSYWTLSPSLPGHQLLFPMTRNPTNGHIVDSAWRRNDLIAIADMFGVKHTRVQGL